MITVRNESVDVNTDRVIISVSKMNACTLDLLSQIHRKCNSLTPKLKENVDMLEIVAMAKTLPTEELYSSSTDLAFPILHDTEISVCIDRNTNNSLSMKRSESLFSNISDFDIPTSVAYQIRGQVMNSLKLSLFRSQYEQLMESMNNLTTVSTDTFEDNVSAKAYSDEVPNDISENLQTSSVITVYGSFGVSELTFELVGEALGPGKGQPLVNVHLEEFMVNYSQKDIEGKRTDITLGSIGKKYREQCTLGLKSRN